MQSWQFSIILTSRNLAVGYLRNCHYKPESIVIAAAVRTPWGKSQGQLSTVSAWELGKTAVEFAVKQSSIPVEQVQKIFMNESPTLQKDGTVEFLFSDFLKKAKYTPTTVRDCDELKMVNFLNAAEFLSKCEERAAVVVGGFQSATQRRAAQSMPVKVTKGRNWDEISSKNRQNYIIKSAMKYSKSQEAGVFDSELVPLSVIQQIGGRRTAREISQDELFSVNCKEEFAALQDSDGASALVLTTFANAIKSKLFPLAIITDFEYLRHSSNILSRTRSCVDKFFSKIKVDPQQIKHWEIEDYSPQLVDFLKQHFNLNLDLINPHGGSLILGNCPAPSLTRLLAHLTHSLHPSEYGCVICCSYQESLVLIIKKMALASMSTRLPLVTLYTKDPCPLCDALVEELELYFCGHYELEKVFIDTNDNIRFLRLYRHDIPVVFLNNQYLCMHRLNRRLLRKRLKLLNT